MTTTIVSQLRKPVLGNHDHWPLIGHQTLSQIALSRWLMYSTLCPPFSSKGGRCPSRTRAWILLPLYTSYPGQSTQPVLDHVVFSKVVMISVSLNTEKMPSKGRRTTGGDAARSVAEIGAVFSSIPVLGRAGVGPPVTVAAANAAAKASSFPGRDRCSSHSELWQWYFAMAWRKPSSTSLENIGGTREKDSGADRASVNSASILALRRFVKERSAGHAKERSAGHAG